MKRLVFIFIMAVGTAFFAIACAQQDGSGETDVRIYYVDAELNRLLPYSDTVPEADTGRTAQFVLDKLIEGRDYNPAVRRLIPCRKNIMNVDVRGSTAYVDLSSDIPDDIPLSRDVERLIIYQITDTLTELKGIRFVRFTVDGESRRDFMGYYDMREVYKFTYPE